MVIIESINYSSFEIFLLLFQNYLIMVFNFDLESALRVKYIPPLQNLNIENIQDSESVH